MSNRVGSGDNSVAEIARRIAEEAARRAAEAARQAAEAARRAAAQAEQNPANAALKKDAYETSQSAAAQQAWLHGEASPVASSATSADLATQSLNSAQATTLLNEDVHDAAENCLDASIEYAAETDGEVILLDPAPDGPSSTGHALVRNEEGYWDPSTGNTYETFEDWQAASADPASTPSPTQGELYQVTPELGLDETTGEPRGISGRALYEITTAPASERGQLLQELSTEIGVSPTFFGEHAYANGGPITVPSGVATQQFPEDPSGVTRVNVADVGEPLSSQLQASYAVQTNTGAGAGVSIVPQDGALYVAVNADGQLVDLQNGTPQVFQSGTVNTMSVFANVNMEEPAAVQQAYATALSLTQEQPVQALPTTEPLTADQVAAYQALGYTVAVLDPANGNAAIRPPDAANSGDIANIGSAEGSEPVYVLVGGPPLETFGDLTPEQLGELYTAANALPDPAATSPDALGDAVGTLVDTTDAMWNGSDLNTGAMTALTMFATERFAPTQPLGDGKEISFLFVVDALAESGGPEVAQAVATGLALEAVDPGNAQAGIHSGEIAAQAMRLSTSPEIAQAVLETVGPQNMEAFIGSIGMGAMNDPNNPLYLDSGSRSLELTHFMEQAARIQGADGMPNAAQASFFLGVFNQASSEQWRREDFRTAMGTGLATSFAMGDAELAATEGARLSALLANPHMGELLQNVSPQEREQIMLLSLVTPGLNSALLDEHGGNLATAAAFAQYQQGTQALTADLLDGTPVLGPDGQPLLPTGELPPPPQGLDMSAYPAIAALPQPVTAAGIQQAVAAGQLTGADAAAYLRGMAELTTPIANADMEAFGSSPAMTNVIGFFEDFNPFNDPNPLSRSNVNDMATVQRDSLLALADVLEDSTDPAFIAQGLTAGATVDSAFWSSMKPFGEAVAAMGDRVQSHRQMTMMAVGMAASIAAPMMMASGLGAMAAGTTASTVFGVPITVTPFVSAALPAATTGVLSTTINASSQYDSTGSVNWGNALLGGTVDGLTSFFGATVAAKATAQGWGFTRTVVTAATIDATGSFGSYVLGTPGALEGILSGDPTHLNAALSQAGFSFVLSAGMNGVTYRAPTGEPPPLNPATDYASNSATMQGLLSDGTGSLLDGSGPRIMGLSGQPVDPQALLSQPYESYFAVYRNSSTGEMLVQEVARSQPGTPLQLNATDTINGIRGGAPGTGWEPVGGFHNHPNGLSGASPEDLMMEPVFRGEFGEGFASFTVSSDGAQPFLNSDTRPMSLQQALDAGYPGVLNNGQTRLDPSHPDWAQVNGVVSGYVPTQDPLYQQLVQDYPYLADVDIERGGSLGVSRPAERITELFESSDPLKFDDLFSIALPDTAAGENVVMFGRGGYSEQFSIQMGHEYGHVIDIVEYMREELDPAVFNRFMTGGITDPAERYDVLKLLATRDYGTAPMSTPSPTQAREILVIENAAWNYVQPYVAQNPSMQTYYAQVYQGAISTYESLLGP